MYKGRIITVNIVQTQRS